MSLTFGSLFAGIGGLDLGLERAGMTCRWQVEIDDYARRVLTKHWPGVPKYEDIREVGKELEPVDLIAGGFPCQDISFAGKGAGLHGERSGLFFEAVRVVRLFRPRYVLLENVAALLSRGLDEVLGTLASVGYDAEWDCIPAAAVGAPHIRDRVFIFGYTNDESKPAGTVNDETPRVPQVVADTSGFRFCKGEDEPRSNGQHAATRKGWMQQPSRDSFWLSEPDICRVVDGVSTDMDRLRGLGNAVVPQVAEWLGRRIIIHHRGTE